MRGGSMSTTSRHGNLQSGLILQNFGISEAITLDSIRTRSVTTGREELWTADLHSRHNVAHM